MREMKNRIDKYVIMTRIAAEKLLEKGMKKEPGVDGILVTVGLCIIALILCVVMKNKLTELITSIVDALKTRAEGILTDGLKGGSVG